MIQRSYIEFMCFFLQSNSIQSIIIVVVVVAAAAAAVAAAAGAQSSHSTLNSICLY